MSAIKWLNNLLFLENIFGIYKNYCSQRKIKKYFIVFQIFVLTMLYSINDIVQIYLWLGGDECDQTNIINSGLSASAYLNSLSCIVTSICYSHVFVSYLKSISRVSEWFRNDKKLINSLKKIYWFSIICILLFSILAFFRFVDMLKNNLHMNEFVLGFIFLSQITIRITIIVHNIMLFFIIMVVIYLTKCLNSLISAVQESVGSCNVSSDEQCDITREQIQGWVELYRDLSNCCEKVTLCFGRQFIFSIAISIGNYILIIYITCYKIALNMADIDMFKRSIFALLSNLSSMMLPIVAGQLTRNQGLKFHRVLARLYNTMIIIDSGEAEAKLIKNFMRLIKKNLLEIKLLSKISAGMYMLPVILTLAIKYIIVMLQFNNII